MPFYTGTTEFSEFKCQGPMFLHIFNKNCLQISVRNGSKLWNQKPDHGSKTHQGYQAYLGGNGLN